MLGDQGVILRVGHDWWVKFIEQVKKSVRPLKYRRMQVVSSSKMGAYCKQYKLHMLIMTLCYSYGVNDLVGLECDLDVRGIYKPGLSLNQAQLVPSGQD